MATSATALRLGDAFEGPSLLNPEVVARAPEFGQAFATARPFKHVVIDNFLQPEVAEAMLREFPGVSDPSTLVNEFGVPNPKSAITDVRSIGPAYREIDDYIQSSDFLGTMSRITGIPDLRYDPWYYGAGTHENFHGAGLDPHFDFNIHPKTAQHRRLNAIVYLNKDWDPAWGGEIAFHTNPWDLQNDEKVSIAPAFNRCVVFETTENSWHSVPLLSLPAHLRQQSRKSFTIYLYTDTRPAEEAAPAHGTVYVQLGLPKYIRAGHTLTEADMEIINANLDRRQEYLRNMYKREYRFSSYIADLENQIKNLRRHGDCRVYGRLKLQEVTHPLHPDGWVADRMVFKATLAQKVSEVRAILWLPEGVGHSVDVNFTVDAEQASVTMTGGMATVSVKASLDPGADIDISLAASPTRRAGDTDERMVSVVLDHIELID